MAWSQSWCACVWAAVHLLLLFLGKYATTSLSEKQSVFLLPCQTLQGKHYRLNCLIPICIIQRSDNCKNRDAKGRLRATYACCQPFAVRKAKLRTSAGMSSPAGSSTLTSPLSLRSLSHPCDPPTPTHAGFSLPSGGVSHSASPSEDFLFRDCLVQNLSEDPGWTSCSSKNQASKQARYAAYLGHKRAALCLASQPVKDKAQQNLSPDKPIPLGSPILQTSPDI